jgi:uncharacterized lipoprotein YddW (UPF0748 family)
MSGIIWSLETIQVSNWVMIQRSGNPQSKHVGVNLAWVTTQVSNRVVVIRHFIKIVTGQLDPFWKFIQTVKGKIVCLIVLSSSICMNLIIRF